MYIIRVGLSVCLPLMMMGVLVIVDWLQALGYLFGTLNTVCCQQISSHVVPPQAKYLVPIRASHFTSLSIQYILRKSRSLAEMGTEGIFQFFYIYMSGLHVAPLANFD